MGYYLLKISIDECLNKKLYDMLYEKYVESSYLHNFMVSRYLNNIDNETFDAGFDLFVVKDETLNGMDVYKLNHHIKCEMRFYNDNKNVSSCYYLYPRSSTGSKTPLRLANSIGIIDSGYRGNIISAFDNISNNEYKISQFQRLTQICSPNITYPMYVKLVSNKELQKSDRGEKGFGSSGT
jgi:dUTP pyrophosphatase